MQSFLLHIKKRITYKNYLNDFKHAQITMHCMFCSLCFQVFKFTRNRSTGLTPLLSPLSKSLKRTVGVVI